MSKGNAQDTGAPQNDASGGEIETAFKQKFSSDDERIRRGKLMQTRGFWNIEGTTKLVCSILAVGCVARENLHHIRLRFFENLISFEPI